MQALSENRAETAFSCKSGWIKSRFPSNEKIPSYTLMDQKVPLCTSSMIHSKHIRFLDNGKSIKHVASMIEYLKIKQTEEVHVDMFLDFWLLFEAFLPSKLHKT